MKGKVGRLSGKGRDGQGSNSRVWLYFGTGWRLASLGALVYAGVKLREKLHIGEAMDMDGTISGWMLRTRTTADFIPQNYEEDRIDQATCDTDSTRVCSTSTVYGDNGYMYRRMDMTFTKGNPQIYPFMSLLRCKDEVEDNVDYREMDCTPDYTHVLPLYHRIFCFPLVVAERFLGMLKPEDKPRALVIGMGGGTWTGFLQTLYPNMRIDVVEVEPQVVKQAKRWFGFKEDSNTTVIIDDGEAFVKRKAQELVKENGAKYDLVFVDIYNSGDVPESMNRLSFYRNLSGVMSDKSCLAISLNTRTDENFSAWRAAHMELGPGCVALRYCPPSQLGSTVLFMAKGWKLRDPLNLNTMTMLYHARKWSFAHNLPFDAGRKVRKAASPSFPGLKHRYFPTRATMEQDEAKKQGIRKALAEETVSSSAASSSNERQ